MDTLVREYKFKSFSGAIDFVNRLAKLAEERDHHPDILVKYNVVMLTFYTHTAGGVTEKDIRLAAETDELFGKPAKDLA